MLTLDALTSRRGLIDESTDLSALRGHLTEQARPVIERMPPVPAVKALLSRDGGICPDDATPLEFDPWSPEQHRCPRCRKTFSGARHHAHWARAQHLWLAERAVHLATLCAVAHNDAAGRRARDILAAYYDLYFELPNRDNVLGPSHLFFSTYLESIWILDFLSAAFLLREVDALEPDDIEKIDAIANEAATIIAEFNEGMSNRQTWNSAALTAIAVWFGDDELAESSIEGRTGLLGHLADGFGADGMWFEGENYHLFALRGLLVGLQWSVTAGADLLADDDVAAHFGRALMAPADTSLPDLTFPARKDARFGVSLAHPAYLECFEAGFAMLAARAPTELASWIVALYSVPPRQEQIYDAYLHQAGQPLPGMRARADLSWWALLTCAPAMPDAPPRWTGSSRLLEQQGLAVLRHDTTYLSLECGGGGSGHSHPDRLALTLHANGEHWLPDPGTGSYTSRDLFWYRSTLAHNAPMLDGHDQALGDEARTIAFDAHDGWGWCTATWGDVRRSLVAGPRWAVDVVHLDSGSLRTLELPWHLSGDLSMETAGAWESAVLANEFVSDVERFTTGLATPAVLVARARNATLRTWFVGDGELLRANGPGLPNREARKTFYLRRAEANTATMITVLDPAGVVTAVAVDGSAIEIHEGATRTTVRLTHHEAAITTGETTVTLGGVLPMRLPPVNFVRDHPMVTSGEAVWIGTAPALDGSLDGFDLSRPLAMDEEHNYFRSEEPYPGPEVFSATAWVNWSDDDLFVAVDVTKDGMVIRDADARPLNLDNEPEDVNADSLQVYCRNAQHQTVGWLVSPAPGGELRARPIGPAGEGAVTGRWLATRDGYRVTLRVPCPNLIAMRRTERLAFDIIINEMREGRTRRSGQLIWSAGPGWVYLRGDRHDAAAFGELELVG